MQRTLRDKNFTEEDSAQLFLSVLTAIFPGEPGLASLLVLRVT